MKQLVLMVAALTAGLSGCSEPSPADSASDNPAPEAQVVSVKGQWLTEADGSIATDPQPSGLSSWQNQLVTISDGSADSSQQRQLHIIDPTTAKLAPKTAKMRLGSRVRRSCFAAYLGSEPDLEALIADPIDPEVFYTVTEDATRTGALSSRCQKRYSDSGSTDYPTLLLRLERLDDGDILMTRVRPLQFKSAQAVGDFPNDGVEGMALGENGRLYLGLEKDKAGKPRIFSVDMTDGFWETTDFAPVSEPALQLPQLHEGSHPINALEYYIHPETNQPYLLAIARNDNELWVIDATGERPARQIKMDFLAPAGGEQCSAYERMDNASIEGVTVVDGTLWMINDPWKVNYLKNIQCQSNQANYEAMAALLFSTPLQNSWFAGDPENNEASEKITD
ncbi:hypothetical protein IT774_02330 [Salinimonas marina]|uniref:Phytase-like domain-containing protein n=1 Tax=Salinimonas marina TaxID=2785918 RepID=A0A7S9DY06_9ALTE|nr:hypothetical protein [Salinimonas marina]QPG06087.1 hypothetical protein IT774_02330 [Salinimonas marina]